MDREIKELVFELDNNNELLLLIQLLEVTNEPPHNLQMIEILNELRFVKQHTTYNESPCLDNVKAKVNTLKELIYYSTYQL